jgi:hypothetical protein
MLRFYTGHPRDRYHFSANSAITVGPYHHLDSTGVLNGISKRAHHRRHMCRPSVICGLSSLFCRANAVSGNIIFGSSYSGCFLYARISSRGVGRREPAKAV